ncbi:MAG: hypothetical protein L6Q38_12885 [Nitrospira sp.]|nr:hypothetical protein [Nitrospira sp.]
MNPTSRRHDGPSVLPDASTDRSCRRHRVRFPGAASLLLLLTWPTAAVQITQSSLSTDGHLHLRWTTSLGKSYAVESSPGIQGPWNTVHEQRADSTSLDWSDPIPATNQMIRLYRISESDSPVAGTLTLSLHLADLLPARLGELFTGHLDTCASAIYLASTLRGGVLTTNGTLSQMGSQWGYDPAPVDGLEVRFASGTNLTYRTRQLAGDFSGNATTFLNSGHTFEFLALQPGVQELWLISRRPSGNCGISPFGAIHGSLVYSNTTFAIDVQATGPYCFENDLSGYSLLQDYRTTGTLTTQGFRLAVDHRRRYEAVGSGPGDATSEQVWLAHQLTLGADLYLWTDVKRQKSFRHGKASQWEPPGYWNATGQILKNGAPVASYAYQPAGPPSDIYLRFLLRIGTDTVELERWAAY